MCFSKCHSVSPVKDGGIEDCAYFLNQHELVCSYDLYNDCIVTADPEDGDPEEIEELDVIQDIVFFMIHKDDEDF